MLRPQGLARTTITRIGVLLLLGGLTALLTLAAAACGGAGPPANAPPTGGATTAPTLISATIYSSPTCGCCHQYIPYLEAEGFEVTSVEMENLTPIKDSLGIPPNMQSCHTVLIDDYYVEGHVPIAAIQKLLRERPAIDGITLPGMPPGSPGMGGEKAQPFVIYAVTDGVVDHFMTL